MARDAGGRIPPGTLVVVGTPIGNLGDLSPRAAETLAGADVIACEDTRHTGMLLARSGIEPKRLLSLHEHNEASRVGEIVAMLGDGMIVALVSDAGMPVVSDPGSRIVSAAAGAGHAVRVVPGPSAGVAACAVSGLVTGRYTFEGFLPRRGADRRGRVNAVASSSCPSVIFESPVRVAATLEELARACGADRRVAICRELTKLHEDVWRGSLGAAVARTVGRVAVGEHVLVVDGAGPPAPAGADDMEALLRHHLGAGMSRRDAVSATAGELALPRRLVYDAALKLPAASTAEPVSAPAPDRVSDLGEDPGGPSGGPAGGTSGGLDAGLDARPGEQSEALTWTDSHCHAHGMPDPIAVIERASQASVTRVVCIGTGEEDWRAALELAATGDGIYATVGLHPHDASAGTSWLPSLLSANAGRIVGIGECGLDYHYNYSPGEAQRRAFAEQIELAHRHELPLIVHTREAWDDTFALLESGGVPKGLILHCFSGGPDEAQRCLDLGAYISFSGIVTFKKAEDVRVAAKRCPLERLLIETDSPFLAPVPHRGHQNEPMWVPLVGAAVAELKGITVAHVAKVTEENASAIFGLVSV